MGFGLWFPPKKKLEKKRPSALSVRCRKHRKQHKEPVWGDHHHQPGRRKLALGRKRSKRTRTRTRKRRRRRKAAGLAARAKTVTGRVVAPRRPRPRGAGV
jgi:hypothetical protein